MLYSLASLTAVQAASRDPHRRAINGVHFSEDGSTIATDGMALISISPVDQKLTSFPAVGGFSEPGEDGVTLDPETVDQVLRNLPKGRPEMCLAAMTQNSKGQVELTTTDLRQTQRVVGQRRRERFPEWKSVLREAAGKARKTRICLDRKKLMSLLATIDTACGRGADSVVYLELGEEGDAVLLRAENRMTGQRIVAMMSPINTRGRWLRPSRWERRVLGRDAKRKVERK